MRLFRLLAMAGAFLQVSFAMAASPLVDVDWVKANIGAEGVVFIDLRPRPQYLAWHIPGAVHSQYGGPKDQWRDRVGKVRGLVQHPDRIAAHLGSLGVSNDTHVVLVTAGRSSSDMGTATRVYWTLNYLGHDEVSILNGGMGAYIQELDANKQPANPLEKGDAVPVPVRFTANPRPEMLVSAAEVDAMAADGTLLVDNRTNDYHLGINKSGAATVAGTLPGSVNLPHTWATENAGGTFRDNGALAKLYAAAGVPLSGPQISFCNTGHLATIGWFVSHELLGNEEALMFDGSMAEWTHSGRATEKKVDF